MAIFKVGTWSNTQFEHVVFTGSAAQTYTLGDAHQTPGLRVVLKNEGTGAVTINTSKSQTIDGASSFVLGSQYSYVVLFSDGTNWSVEAVRNAPSANVALTGQTAAITTTPLFTAPVAGLYRVTTDILLTAAGTAGTIQPTISSNNGVAAYSQPGATVATTLGAEGSQEFTFYSAAGQAVNYAVAFNTVTGTPAYALRLRAEFLG